MRNIFLLLLFLILPLAGCKPEAVEFDRSEDTTYIPPGEGFSTQGPVVNFIQKPKSHWIGESTRARFEVIAGDFQIDQLDCAVDRVLVGCTMDNMTVELSGYDLGTHEIVVEAIDTRGLLGRATARWFVTDQYFPINQSVNIQGGGNRADVLFVIDNSSSMRLRQSSSFGAIRFFKP